jgi:hypothetical protein
VESVLGGEEFKIFLSILFLVSCHMVFFFLQLLPGNILKIDFGNILKINPGIWSFLVTHWRLQGSRYLTIDWAE